MIHIICSSWPQQSSEACSKAFMGAPPKPAFINEKGPYMSFGKGVGVESIHILEFDSSKVEEASDYIGKRILAFSAVPGFSCASQTWYDASDVVKRWMT